MNDRDCHPLTYRAAGVDVDQARDFVDAIAPVCATTFRPGAVGAIGGFGALFDLRAAGYADPILVSAADGVGTKLRVAIEAGLHGGIGEDLVAMCVNDVATHGAEPLFLLDYFATGALDPALARTVVEGIARACAEVGCALVGGETAEMPGMYAPGDYDLAGFAVGAVERGAVLPRRESIEPGDVLLALPSSGPHANGYSLLRRVVERTGLGWHDPAPFAPERTLAAALLEPTRLYARAALAAHRTGHAKAMVHVTGGGLVGNVPRVLPAGTRAVLDASSWAWPAIFSWAAAAGPVSAAEMWRTFNCGVGWLVVCSSAHVQEVVAALRGAGEHPFPAGRIEAAAGAPRCELAP